MSRKKETLTLSVPPGTKEQLEELARRLNIFWGKSPSPSGLIVAIAQQTPEVRKLFTLRPTQVEALLQATRILTDSGHAGEAQTLLSLLLDQGDLEAPMRQSLSQLANQPSVAWRTQVDRHINNHQPFRLVYLNAQDEELEFTVRYAEISFEEKRFYLEIWCEETDDLKNPDYPELVHNRCLRFDRIKAIEPMDGLWRDEGLDFLKVYLHFCRGMVKAYERRPKHISEEDRVIGDVRQVVRRVSNPFWLIREVFRYGEDCVIVSPDSVRDRFQQKLIALCRHYDIDIPD